MDAHQFVHIEIYAAKRSKLKKNSWTAADIAGEAERVPKNCPHVAAPESPELLFGVSPSVALRHAEALLNQQRDPRGRRVRRDTPCILAGVASYPIPVNKANEAEVQRWIQDCINHLQATFGSGLKSVLLHRDETYPHIHFYLSANDGRAKAIHPGHHRAKQHGKGGYSAGMREFQDKWFDAVSKHYGMLRCGPRRKRLSPRQQAALRLANAEKVIAASEKVKQELDAKQVAIDAQKEKLDAERLKFGRYAGELTTQEAKRRDEFDEKLKSLNAEILALESRKEAVAAESERLRAAGLEFIAIQKLPITEATQRIVTAETATSVALGDLEKVRARLDGIEALHQQDAERLRDMEALLTPSQRERLRRKPLPVPPLMPSPPPSR